MTFRLSSRLLLAVACLAGVVALAFAAASPATRLRPGATDGQPAVTRQPVSPTRKLVLFGFLALGLASIAATAAVLSSRSNLELARIRRRYGSTIQPVSASPAGPLVDTKTFDDLAVIAAMDQRAILQRATGRVTTFYVVDNDAVYRHRVGARW